MQTPPMTRLRVFHNFPRTILRSSLQRRKSTKSQKYRNMSSARKYQDLLDAFVAVSEARNNKIIELNALYVEWDAANSQITKNENAIRELQTQIASITDPRLAKAKLFMEGAYRDVIASIRRCLYSIYRAYYYYSLDDARLVVNDLSIAALRSTQVVILDKYSKARETQASHPLGSFACDIRIAQYVTKHDWLLFQKGKDLTFTISTKDENTKSMAQIFSKQDIALVYRRQRAAPRVRAIFIHHGRSTMIDVTGQEHVFSHLPVTVSYAVDKHGAPTESGDFSEQFKRDGASAGLKREEQGHNGVGLYGPWTVVLDDVESGKRRDISDIEIHFSGVKRTRPMHLSPPS